MGDHPCTGVCHIFGATKGGARNGCSTKGISPYEGGFCRCSTCMVYLKTEARLCPCCRQPLRRRPSATVLKKRVNPPAPRRIA